MDCRSNIKVSKYASLEACRCDECRIKREKSLEIIDQNCNECDAPIRGRRGKLYCDICIVAARKNAGLKSAASQNKRSKNEILFFDKLSKMFPEYLINSNEQFFIDKNQNYWDADIIIHDLKIAIHWNGNWHYQKITEKHSVAQVQSRDRIKYSVVENNGYTNYVVEDRGKFNEEKVEEELQRFILYIGRG